MRMLISLAGAALLIAAPVAARACGRAGAAHDPEAMHDHAMRAPREARPMSHAALADDPDSGVEMIGKPAPAWTFTRWIGPPLSLEGLRGKVVLVRWWNEGCYFCAATLPAIERLRIAHAAEGLVCVGVFHPKPPHEVKDAHVAALAKRLGFHGALALDRDWQTLDRYRLDGHPDRDWTSVSFLIDREGVVRWVHGGGEYHPSSDPAHARCDLQYADLERVLAKVLAEPAPGATGTR
ncbi:MAG: redoxin domain-containing protein [Candidatus Eisenbacteria bacterium]|uniref:Redoxin domain-containing protein n=1 Tax=Eiseniibacteriota bacterium TaxID=2212470 RepID=A0A9D6L8E2_UNCEI|nr:redoxin domain-containing protein [Candidatus Eisenbacteria bacterium]